MAPKRTVINTTTSMIDAQLKALIDQGVADALAVRDANNSRNDDDNHDSGTSTVTPEVAYAIPWRTLKKMMIDKYCPMGEIKKLKIEIWNLKVKESDKIEKQKDSSTIAERQVENKRKLDNNNQAQQQPPKKQGMAIAYTAGSGERKEYTGTLPLYVVPTGRVIIPTSRVIVATGRYVVPAEGDSNGNNLKRTRRDRDGGVIILPSTTAEEHIAVKGESKARTTLLQSILDDYVADFHYMDDARDIWNAVKARFGGNAKSKKIRKSMLKQEFSEFRIGEVEGLHKGYDGMQKILSQLNQLKAKPDDEDINLKFLRALPSSWSQVALTLKTKGGLELLSFDDLYYKLKTLEVDVKGYTTFSSSQSEGPSHSAFVSATSASKKMSYEDSLNYSSTATYSVPSNSKTGSHRSGDAGEFSLMGVTSEENELGWDDSAFSVFTTNSEDVEGRPIFYRFAKADSMKVLPPPLSGDYTSLSDHSYLDESQMSYGTKSSTSSDSKYVSNDFASSDSSVKSSEPKPNDSTSCVSTSSDLPSHSCNSSDKNENTSRTSCNKNGYKKAGHSRKNASSVSKLCFVCGSGTHLIKDYDFYEKQMANKTIGIEVGHVHSRNKVNHLNQFVPQVVLLRTGKVTIPPARPQPVPNGKPKVFAPDPTGRQNRPFPVPTDRGYSPSVSFGWWKSTARSMPHFSRPTSSYFQTYTPYVPTMSYNHMKYGKDR
nr:xylulose kinase-1 [Tanacetum cinerariifolium]